MKGGDNPYVWMHYVAKTKITTYVHFGYIWIFINILGMKALGNIIVSKACIKTGISRAGTNMFNDA